MEPKFKSRKGPVLFLAAAVVVAIFAVFLSVSSPTSSAAAAPHNGKDYSYLNSELFPEEGFRTKIILGDTITELVESGAIDLDKFKEIYGDRLAGEKLDMLTKPGSDYLVLTSENANFIINLMWPLGLANKNPLLNEMEEYEGVANLASTGGWTLSKEDSMNYFNKLEIIKLTPEQQRVFEEVAQNTYRPCCDNPTAFQDCNHGSALLALLQLGASQGLDKKELYTLALQANTLWFPQQYLSTAVLFESQGKDYWSSAQEIMGYDYSSASGWIQNVYKPLQKADMLPSTTGGGSCSV